MKVFSFALWFLQLDHSITMLTTFCCHLLLLVQLVQCKNLEIRGGVPEMQSSMGSQVNQELVRKNPRLFFSVSHSVWNWFHFEVKCEKITLNFSHQKFFNSNIYKKKKNTLNFGVKYIFEFLWRNSDTVKFHFFFLRPQLW